MKNKYIPRAKINERKFKQMLQLFCLDLTASQIADVMGLNRNTVNRYLTEIRSCISEYCRLQADDRDNAKRCAGSNKGHGTKPSTLDIRFVGLTKKNGKIRCCMIDEGVEAAWGCTHEIGGTSNGDLSKKLLGQYGGLIDLNKMKYIKIQPGENGGNGKRNGIDICDGFWGFARIRMQRFRGIRKNTALLHIMECEFRYNHGQKELYPLLLRIIRERRLFQ
jgi:hypothetical protein